MRNIKYLFPLAMSAMVACKPEPTPTPEPTPPTPPKPKTENISIKSMDNLRTVRTMTMDAKNTYNATWANNFAAAPAEHSVIGEVDALAGNRTYFNHDKNGKGVYPTDANSVLTMEQWASGNYTDLVAGPNGEKYHVSHDQVAQFEARGETDINKIAKPTTIIELTAADASDFSAAIKRIAAQNPTEAVNVHVPFDVDVKDESVLKLLRSLHVDNPSAKIYVTDTNGNPADLDIAKIWTNTWDLRPGGNTYWIRASGIETELQMANPDEAVRFVAPTATENIVNLMIPKEKADFTILELNGKTVPNDCNPLRSIWFKVSAHEFAFYVPSELGLSLQTENGYADSANRSGNSLKIKQYLAQYNISLDPSWGPSDWYLSYGETDVWSRYCILFTPNSWAADSRTKGKRPFDAATMWVNPNKRENPAIATRSVAKYNRMQNTR